MQVSQLQETADVYDEGEWIGDIPQLPGIRLKLLSMNAPEVVRAIARGLRARFELDDDGEVVPSLSDDTHEKVNTSVLLDLCLVDWHGLKDGKKPFPCTPENKAALSKNDVFMMALEQASGKATSRQAKRIEALAKNSQKPSTSKRAAAA